MRTDVLNLQKGTSIMDALKNLNWKVVAAGVLGAASAYLSGTTDLTGAIMTVIALFLPAFKKK